jgi:hypothetical protein
MVYTYDVAADVAGRLRDCVGFEWDQGNGPKIQARHGVTLGECEQVFFREPFLVAPSASHSGAEERWAGLGRTAAGRALVVVFPLRGNLIRPISARDMNRKERQHYAEAEAEAEAGR